MLRLALALCAVSALAPAQSAARDLTGEIVLRERLALPKGTRADIEVLAADGSLALIEIVTEGRQPPFAYRVTVPDGALLTRARLRTPDGRQWTSPPAQVPAGTADHDQAPAIVLANPSIGFASFVSCGPALLRIGFLGMDAHAQRGSQFVKMTAASDPPNRRFSDGRSLATVLDASDTGMHLIWQGQELAPCVAFPDPAQAEVRALGSDPAWQAGLTNTGMTYSTPEGDGGTAQHAVFDMGEDQVTWHSPGLPALTLTPRICRLGDGALPYPAQATLHSAPPRRGCAGDPVQLLQGDWRLVMLTGAAVPEGIAASLSVTGTRVAGEAGCNRLTASLTQGGAELRLDTIATTRMACAEDRMAFESRLLAALARVRGFDLTEDGDLTLSADGDTLAVLVRP
ncbi:MAG: META domain-containing protein [Rhodobacteraceae bacterium]|nr:META domain-containing protein [Paracoccaceae bacterium]